MSESEPRSEAEDPPFSLDLAACARVLAEQKRARTIEQEVEKAKERLREAAARSLVTHVLSQLPAALAADDCSSQVRVPPPAGVGKPRGACDLACRYLDRYFGITDEQAKQGTGWQLYGSGPFFVSRPLLTSIVERMAREAATEQTEKVRP